MHELTCCIVEKFHLSDSDFCDCFCCQEEEAEEEEPEEEVAAASYSDILKLNKPEAGYIIVGCTFAAALGVAMPAFAILFSEIVTVSTHISRQLFSKP